MCQPEGRNFAGRVLAPICLLIPLAVVVGVVVATHANARRVAGVQVESGRRNTPMRVGTAARGRTWSFRVFRSEIFDLGTLPCANLFVERHVPDALLLLFLPDLALAGYA